jgi:DNA-binding NarL/FixJ family response regulator
MLSPTAPASSTPAPGRPLRPSAENARQAGPEPDPTGVGLTPREREVLALLGNGLTNAQIARTLYISEKTASVHVSNILRKFGVTSRIQAAAAANLKKL